MMTSPPLKGLTARREQKGLTQAELAAELGITQSHINKFEKGLVRLDIYRAAKLAKLLHCGIEDLL